MLKGETLQGLFDRLMVIINKMRALGCEDWDDHKVTRWFLRAYQVKNMGLAQIIRDRDDYDEMKPHTLLGKLQQHEMADQAAIKAARKSAKCRHAKHCWCKQGSGSQSHK